MPIPNYDNVTAAKLIHSFVPISRLNKGEAGKIIEEVKSEGIRVIVKNNVPECVMITVEEYDRFVLFMNRPVKIVQTKEQEERRKAFIKKIREDVPPIMPAKDKLERQIIMDKIGPIDIDEEAVNELRRLG